MTRHLDEMRQYINLSTAPSIEPIHEEVITESALDELVPERNPILEQITDIIFKLQSHRLVEGSDEYNQGVEEGLLMATNMLMRIIDENGKL